MGVDSILEIGPRFRCSETEWWAWEESNLRLHPQVKISARGGKLPDTYQGRRGPGPPPRSRQRPRGRVVLPIFIRQGWPQAMSHLSAIGGSPLCNPAFLQVA